jgi:hypothetical protein
MGHIQVGTKVGVWKLQRGSMAIRHFGEWIMDF